MFSSKRDVSRADASGHSLLRLLSLDGMTTELWSSDASKISEATFGKFLNTSRGPRILQFKGDLVLIRNSSARDSSSSVAFDFSLVVNGLKLFRVDGLELRFILVGVLDVGNSLFLERNRFLFDEGLIILPQAHSLTRGGKDQLIDPLWSHEKLDSSDREDTNSKE